MHPDNIKIKSYNKNSSNLLGVHSDLDTVLDPPLSTFPEPLRGYKRPHSEIRELKPERGGDLPKVTQLSA